MAVFHFDKRVTSRIIFSDLRFSLNPDIKISLKIIKIDDKTNKLSKLLISGIKVKITSNLSAIGSNILPISVSSLFFLANQPSKKSEIAANIKRIKDIRYNTPNDKLLPINKSKGIINAIMILEKVSRFGIKES